MKEARAIALRRNGIELGVCKIFIVRVCLAVFHVVVFAYLVNLWLTMQVPPLVLPICERLPVSNRWGK